MSEIERMSPGMPPDDRLLWGVVANAGRLATVRKPRWSHVADAVGVGSTSAHALCVRFGFDPEATCGHLLHSEIGRHYFKE